MNNIVEDFFEVGGCIPLSSPSYVKREADDILFQYTVRGELCYVFNTRQMGKSSLMIRTVHKLKSYSTSVHTVIIDLTTIGSVSEEVWYRSLSKLIHIRLRLKSDFDHWWEQHHDFPHLLRFTNYLQEVVLQEAKEPVIIFIDEIDKILEMTFSDDFFGGIRGFYNHQRMQENNHDHKKFLTFVLMGAVSRSKLVADYTKTPFNVGKRINLEDLKIEDSHVLVDGLPNKKLTILERIFFWTDGHPYLTQKLGKEIADHPEEAWTDKKIDSIITKVFLYDGALSNEKNLSFVQKSILSSPNKKDLLQLYLKIYRSKRPIRNDEQSSLQDELKLAGLIKADDNGYLQVRNKIYREAFDLDWIKAHIPIINWWPRVSLGIFLLSIVIVSLVLFLRPEPEEILAESYITSFQNTTNPTVRLSNLSNLLELTGYEEQALALYGSLSIDEQTALFNNVTTEFQPQAEKIIQETYYNQYAVDLTVLPQNTKLLRSMLFALEGLESDAALFLTNEIGNWVKGREQAASEMYLDAWTSYSLAIRLNGRNPSTWLERALLNIELRDYFAATADLNSALALDPVLENTIVPLVVDDPILLETVWQSNAQNDQIILLIPTMTQTPSPTSTGTPTTTSTPTSTVTNTPTFTSTPTATSTSTTTPMPTDTATPIPPPPPSDLLITTPVNGLQLPRNNVARGVGAQEANTSGIFLNVIVIAPDEGGTFAYWAQRPISVDSNGNWTASSVYLGRANVSEDIGKEYQICALLLDRQLPIDTKISPFTLPEKSHCVTVKRTS